MQSFVLTFLAEWGDRSQIATIAVRNHLLTQHPKYLIICTFYAFLIDFMSPAFNFCRWLLFLFCICFVLLFMTFNFLVQLATHKNAIGVAAGATIGHTICTSVAVVGGSMLASRISQRSVATVGGLLFLGFSLSSYFYPPLD
jgi:putative Ca2+/H+ antiporter (TMEM165/GDT1 family)